MTGRVGFRDHTGDTGNDKSSQKQVLCYYCGKAGHVMARCHYKLGLEQWAMKQIDEDDQRQCRRRRRRRQRHPKKTERHSHKDIKEGSQLIQKAATRSNSIGLYPDRYRPNYSPRRPSLRAGPHTYRSGYSSKLGHDLFYGSSKATRRDAPRTVNVSSDVA